MQVSFVQLLGELCKMQCCTHVGVGILYIDEILILSFLTSVIKRICICYLFLVSTFFFSNPTSYFFFIYFSKIFTHLSLSFF